MERQKTDHSLSNAIDERMNLQSTLYSGLAKRIAILSSLLLSFLYKTWLATSEKLKYNIKIIITWYVNEEAASLSNSNSGNDQHIHQSSLANSPIEKDCKLVNIVLAKSSAKRVERGRQPFS